MTENPYRAAPDTKEAPPPPSLFRWLCWLFLVAHILAYVAQRSNGSIYQLPACARDHPMGKTSWEEEVRGGTLLSRFTSVLGCVALIAHPRARWLSRLAIVLDALLLGLVVVFFTIRLPILLGTWPISTSDSYYLWYLCWIVVWLFPFAFRFLRDCTVRSLAQLHGISTVLYLSTPRAVASIRQIVKPTVCVPFNYEMGLLLAGLALMCVASIATLVGSFVLKPNRLPPSPSEDKPKPQT